MGKKKKAYSKEGLESLRYYLFNVRTGISNSSLPDFQITSNLLLEEAVRRLPKDEQKSIESFFGLLPGTIIHSRQYAFGKPNDTIIEMYERAKVGLKSLCSLDYLYIYENGCQALVHRISQKLDYANTDISILDGVKYLMAYYIFLKGGSSMFYDEEEPIIDLAAEEKLSVDDYALLSALWKEWISLLPDNDFRLELVIQRINELDLAVKVPILVYVKIAFSANLMEYSLNTFKYFVDIRKFKEEFFTNGPWLLFDSLVCKSTSEAFDYNSLAKIFNLYRKGSLEEIRTSDTLVITLLHQKINLPLYRKCRIIFTDPEEIDFLYLHRSQI